MSTNKEPFYLGKSNSSTLIDDKLSFISLYFFVLIFFILLAVISSGKDSKTNLDKFFKKIENSQFKFDSKDIKENDIATVYYSEKLKKYLPLEPMKIENNSNYNVSKKMLWNVFLDYLNKNDFTWLDDNYNDLVSQGNNLHNDLKPKLLQISFAVTENKPEKLHKISSFIKKLSDLKLGFEIKILLNNANNEDNFLIIEAINIE